MKLQASLQHKCSPVKFAKFLRTPILKNICERLFLFKYEYKYKENIWNGRKHIMSPFDGSKKRKSKLD